MTQNIQAAEKTVRELIENLQSLKKEIQKIIVGQEETIDQLLITFMAGGTLYWKAFQVSLKH